MDERYELIARGVRDIGEGWGREDEPNVADAVMILIDAGWRPAEVGV